LATTALKGGTIFLCVMWRVKKMQEDKETGLQPFQKPKIKTKKTKKQSGQAQEVHDEGVKRSTRRSSGNSSPEKKKTF